MGARFQRDRMIRTDRLVKKGIKEAKKFFREQEERILADMQKSAKIEVKSFNELDELWATVEIIEPMLYNSVMQGIKGVGEYFAPAGFILNEKWISQWVARIAIKESRMITQTTQNELIKTIAEGNALGEGSVKIADRVREVFDFATETRSMLIARTETARGMSEAQIRNYEQMGYEQLKWWLSDDACEICQDLSEQEWDINNSSGVQPVHPNCNCSFVPKGSLLSQLD